MNKHVPTQGVKVIPLSASERTIKNGQRIKLTSRNRIEYLSLKRIGSMQIYEIIPVKYLLCLFCMCRTLTCIEIVHAQEPLFSVEGKIVVGNDTNNPQPGTIRFNVENKDFEGWNGFVWLSLTPNSIGVLEDVDGNRYVTAQIGNQEWMLENLKVSQYNDMTSLFNFQDSAQWVGLYTTGAWCHYNNDSNNNEIYGKLYNGTAIRSGKLCPSGWEIPSDSDWFELVSSLGGSTIAGGKMKTEGTKNLGSGLWESPNTSATNSSKFSGQPAGYRDGTAQFQNLDIETRWWGSFCTQTGGIENCAAYGLLYDSGELIYSFLSDNWGGSVRCIKSNP